MLAQPSLTLTGTDYDEYLQYQASKQSSSSIASVAQMGNSVACLSQSSTLGPWVLDSGASDHISGNPHVLTQITNIVSLPPVTLANGSKADVQAIGCAKPLPSLALDSVLYIPKCPFNLVSVSKLTRSLNCSIRFDTDSVVIQDRDTGRMIGTGRESQGLYHLHIPSTA